MKKKTKYTISITVTNNETGVRETNDIRFPKDCNIMEMPKGILKGIDFLKITVNKKVIL